MADAFAEFGWMRPRWEGRLLREYFGFNARTFLSSTLKAGYQKIDVLLLGHFFNPAIVGAYQTFRNIAVPLNFISSPYEIIIYPRITKLWQIGDWATIRAQIKKVTLAIAAMGLGVALIRAYLLAPLASYFSLGEVGELRLLYYGTLASMFVNGTAYWWTRAFSNAVNPNLSIYLGLVASVSMLTLVPAFSHWGGLTGYIMAILGVEAVKCTFWLRVYLRIGKL
jgi:O-antigen/teichoic acid export membrane protein